nr:DeoR/GlpR family DNA-binding transcription regulator [Massilistercora timonensis]
MYSQERQSKIVDLLGSQSSVSVSVLADMLKTSKETIRRDLKALESEGILTRTHGGAILNVNTPHVGAAAKFGDAVMNNEYPFALRHIRNIPAKKVIAQKAATLIEDRDTIFIDNSSTTLFLLDYIPQDLHLTIITNSVKVLLEAAKKENPNISLISLAGFYNPNNYSVYGTRTIKSAEEFFPNKTFISCTGVTLNKQLTDISLNEVDTKLAMMRKSEETYLLADHTKFEINGPFYLSGFHSIDYIVTDKYDYSPQTAETVRTITRKYGIRIITD